MYVMSNTILESPVLKYSSADFCGLSLYPPLSEILDQDNLTHKSVDKVMRQILSQFDDVRLQELEKLLGVHFNSLKSSLDCSERVISLPELSFSIEDWNVGARIKIHPSPFPDNKTKVIAGVSLREGMPYEEMHEFIPLAKEKSLDIRSAVAGIYKEFAEKHGIPVNENEPEYNVSLISIGMDHKMARDILLSSREDVMKMKASDKRVSQFIEDFKRLEKDYIGAPKDMQQVTQIFCSDKANTIIDGQMGIVGLYNVYTLHMKSQKEAAFLNFVYGGHEQVECFTDHLIDYFIGSL